MLFSSIPFLYYFLPITLIIYFLTPKRMKNIVLLCASLFFYGWGEPRYVLLMLISIVFGYLFGRLIEKFQGTGWSTLFLVCSLITSLGFLMYYKYADFFIENFNAITGCNAKLLHIALPIGISFYTFQMISYTIDVYKQEVKAQKNIIHLATYVALFPQLIAGPIVRYQDIERQLVNRQHSIAKVVNGIRRFLLGLAKKVLIANELGELCQIFRESEDLSVLFFWMYAIAFTLHIYFDFSGYSDMAIGLGKIFGFDFLENFRYPFISKSITEFWRRWHISLGTWFRDYVYIPMGGSRVAKGRMIFNIVVVWMLTGFWHGAAWNFILWGAMFAFLLMLEKLFLASWLSKMGFVRHIYVMVFVIISFVLFNATSLSQACLDLQGMFGLGGYAFVSESAIYYLKSYGVLFLIAGILSTPIIKMIWEKIKAYRIIGIVEPLFLGSLLLIITGYLVDGSFNPFLYFRF